MDVNALFARRFSKKTMLQIVDYLIDNEDRLKNFINSLAKPGASVSGQSFWVLSYCAEKRPNWIRPQIGKLLRIVEDGNAPVAVKRNVMRALQFVDIPARFHTRAINQAFAFLADPKETVAVKVFSMSVLAKLVDVYPELRREWEIVIEDQLPHASAGFRSRARKVLGEK